VVTGRSSKTGNVGTRRRSRRSSTCATLAGERRAHRQRAGEYYLKTMPVLPVLHHGSRGSYSAACPPLPLDDYYRMAGGGCRRDGRRVRGQNRSATLLTSDWLGRFRNPLLPTSPRTRPGPRPAGEGRFRADRAHRRKHPGRGDAPTQDVHNMGKSIAPSSTSTDRRADHSRTQAPPRCREALRDQAWCHQASAPQAYRYRSVDGPARTVDFGKALA
jgi:hypothetical protein